MPRATRSASAQATAAISESGAQTGTTERSAKTVTVALKLEHGLILQLCKETTWMEETPGGVKERRRHDKVGERIFVRGTSYPVNPPPGFPERGPMADGYALTSGINAEFWNEWLRQNQKLPLVKNKLIFAFPEITSVRAKAHELKDTRSGFEPLAIGDGVTDPRVPKPTNAAVEPIKTAVLD